MLTLLLFNKLTGTIFARDRSLFLCLLFFSFSHSSATKLSWILKLCLAGAARFLALVSWLQCTLQHMQERSAG